MHTVRLPKGWVEAGIGDLAMVLRGVTYKKAQAADSAGDGLVPLLRATNINRELRFTEFVYVPREVVKDEQMLRAGDSVIAASSGSINVVGKAAPVRHDWLGTFGAFCFALRPDPGAIVPLYLSHFLQTTRYRLAVSQLAAGVNINNLKRQHIEEMPIPIAPRAEQHRIVKAIESYLTRLDDAVASLDQVQRNLERYRASVLKAAVEGRLVPTEAELARREGRDYEPASELLKCILVERRKKWIENAAVKTGAKGNAGALLEARKQAEKKYKEPTPPDTTDLPDGWCWVTLPQLGELNRGKSKHRPRNDPRLLGGPYPFIQTGDVRHSNGFIRTHEATYSEFGLAQSRLWPAGTLCITIAANIAETGILSMPACFPDSIVGFLNESLPVLVRYVEFFLRTARRDLERYAPATAQKNINLQVLSLVAVPLPPLAEQERIVECVDELLSVADEAALSADRSTGRSSRLRQSILRWAFEGKLVEQDPNDEPASALLERIKAEYSQPRRSR